MVINAHRPCRCCAAYRAGDQAEEPAKAAAEKDEPKGKGKPKGKNFCAAILDAVSEHDRKDNTGGTGAAGGSDVAQEEEVTAKKIKEETEEKEENEMVAEADAGTKEDMPTE